MDTETLIKLMHSDIKTKPYFQGCMPRNFLPSKLKKNSLYVINLSTSYALDNGTHWVLISTLDPNYSAYICSLGQPPIHKDVIDSLSSHGKSIVYNDFQNQHSLSTVCSFHVLFTASMLSRGHSLIDIMTKFFKNGQYINDLAVTEIISQAHDLPPITSIFDWEYMT